MADVISTCSQNDTSGNTSNGGQWYTTLTAWEAVAQGEYNGTDNQVVECYNDFGGPLDDNLVVGGWETGLDIGAVIRAANGNGHDGVFGAGFTLRSTNSDSAVEMLETCEIENFTVLAGTGTALFLNRSARTFRVNRMFVIGADGSYNLSGTGNGSSIEITNSVFIGGSQIIRMNVLLSGYLSNCTLYGQGTSQYGHVPTANDPAYSVSNLVILGCTTADLFNRTYVDITNIATGDSTAQGPNAITGVVDTAGVDFVDAPNNDFNIVPNPGKLDGTGADLSSDFTDDITGQTRTQWDIGAYGIISAGGVTFDGPDIVAQTGTENTLFSFDENGEGTVASRFTGATSYALSPDSDALPAGLTVNVTTGNIEGTPTEVATRSIIIRGSE